MRSAFKKVLCVFASIVLVFALFFAYNIIFDKGKVSECEVSISDSKYFSKQEIEYAMLSVKSKFRDFEGCSLLTLSYSDEDQEKETVDGNLNIIVISSSFDAIRPKGNSAMTPGMVYKGWKFILTRSSENGFWKVQDWGYA